VGQRASAPRSRPRRGALYPCKVPRSSTWTTRIALLVAFAFGVLSPYRVSPRPAESEEVEAGDSTESEETVHARGLARHERRARRLGGAAMAHLHRVLGAGPLGIDDSSVPAARWQLPRRVVPDDDPIG
jgi:hypothetical protein